MKVKIFGSDGDSLALEKVIDRAMVIWNPDSSILYADGQMVGVEGE